MSVSSPLASTTMIFLGKSWPVTVLMVITSIETLLYTSQKGLVSEKKCLNSISETDLFCFAHECESAGSGKISRWGERMKKSTQKHINHQWDYIDDRWYSTTTPYSLFAAQFQSSFAELPNTSILQKRCEKRTTTFTRWHHTNVRFIAPKKLHRQEHFLCKHTRFDVQCISVNGHHLYVTA